MDGNGNQMSVDPALLARVDASSQADTSMHSVTSEDDLLDRSKAEPSFGPVRGHSAAAEGSGSAGDGSSKAPIAAPVKSACTFCRSRKSRCNGKQPCAACLSREQPDDCHYTISRRGGKPKPKTAKTEPIESHLEKIFDLSDLPHLVRIPNAVPQLQAFMGDDGDGPSFYSATQSNALSPSLSVSNGRNRSESLKLDSSPSTRTLLSDFYSLYYRFIPVTPNPSYLDQLAASMPPESPFLLALQCVLPLIRNEPLVAAPSSNQAEKKAHIRTQAAYMAKRTEAAIDAMLESVENGPEEEDLQILEVIQALCLLVIYEYGSGRALKARLKADTALGIAMSKGLHRLSASGSNNGIRSPVASHSGPLHYLSQIPQGELHEVRKRMWWSLWTMTMWTAYNSGRIPTIRADDPRITSDLPSCSDEKAWPFAISSLQGLLLVQDRVLALSNIENGRLQDSAVSALGGLPFQSPSSQSAFRRDTPGSDNQGIPKSFSGHPTMASKNDILHSMLEIDAALQEQMVVLEQATHGVVSSAPSSARTTQPLDEDTRYLHFMWAIQLYTASLTLHVGQAFQGASLFERKLCFLSSITEANDAAACQVPMPNAFSNDGSFNTYVQTPLSLASEHDLYARGPFLPKDSLRRCVEASDKLLKISRNLRELKGPFAAPNNPFNACSFVLISFVCLMQALAISTNFNDDETWHVLTAPSDAANAAPPLLKSAQSAAALNPLLQQQQQQPFDNGMGQIGAASTSISARQQQLQLVWARVNEAKAVLVDLARIWDIVIPMAEEVGGCLEASQFLLSQQETAIPSIDFPLTSV